VTDTRKRVLGAEHPDTLTSMNNLAFTWKEQGRHTEALKLIEECVRLRSRFLGVNNYLTLSSSTALTEWKMKELDIVTLGVRRHKERAWLVSKNRNDRNTKRLPDILQKISSNL
jgi:dolichyl-phosphate-mannose--protein O-mannosyl transferase